MDIVVDSTDLAAAVKWVRAAVPSRPSTPVLAGVLITTSDRAAHLAGFDYETSRRAVVPARVTTPGGPVLVAAADLARIAAGFAPDKTVAITATEPGTVTIVCGSLTGELPTLPLEDYPTLPPVPEAASVLDAADFAAVIAQVQHASSRDDTMPYLTGIELHTDNGALWATSTDRYRAAFSHTAWSDQPPLPRVLLPRTSLVTAAKHLARAGIIRIGIDDPAAPTIVASTAARYQTTMRVMDAQLPDLSGRIPTEFACDITVNRKALLTSVQQLAKVNQRHTPLCLSTHDSTLTVATHASETATASQQLPCQADTDTAVALDPTYLAQALAAADTDDVVFKYPNANMTSHSHPTTSNPKLILNAGGFRALLVPIRIG